MDAPFKYNDNSRQESMDLDRILDEPGYGSIPDDQLDLLKQEVSLQRLAEGVKVVLKHHGADLIRL